jgi:hypothetical protein
MYIRFSVSNDIAPIPAFFFAFFRAYIAFPAVRSSVLFMVGAAAKILDDGAPR